ncbi:hypothetical protein BKA57DRAFT_439233 [Linnemannia elongata]|nr:hypothetical protein BKA57DRAFT_439233 [Linnemannia elongata]
MERVVSAPSLMKPAVFHVVLASSSTPSHLTGHFDLSHPQQRINCCSTHSCGSSRLPKVPSSRLSIYLRLENPIEDIDSQQPPCKPSMRTTKHRIENKQVHDHA